MTLTALCPDEAPRDDWRDGAEIQDEDHDERERYGGDLHDVIRDPSIEDLHPVDAFRMGAEWCRHRTALWLARRRRVDLNVTQENADRIAETAQRDGWVVEVGPRRGDGMQTLACTRFPGT